MIRDLRIGLRMLLKQPGFTLIAALTLALGIGATSAVFSLIQGVLLTPPPYRQPQQLVLIPSARTDGQQTGHPQSWAAVQWMEWQKQAKSFDAIAAYAWTFNFLVLPEGSESFEGIVVTQDYFRALGLQPVLGRTFLDSETGANHPPVIILGYNLWQRRFSGDPKILGKTIRISRWKNAPTVVGVMPPGVRFLPSSESWQEPNYNVNGLVDYWIPATLDPKSLKDPDWDVVARLRSGSTLNQAQSELAVIAARQAQSDHDFQGITPHVQSLTAESNRDGRRILLPLLGAAALVLLIACGNTAGLLLVRGLQRQHEYAVRSALGEGRWALIRQVSMESLLLAIFGGTAGIALALGIVRLFKLIGGHAIPRLDAVSTGWPVLACGLGLAVVAAVLAGLLPALRASRIDPIRVLNSAGARSSVGRGDRQLLPRYPVSDGAYLDAAGRRRLADSNHDEPREGAIGVRHRTHPDDERHRGARRLVRFSSPGFGACVGAAGRSARRLRLGCALDGKQLARSGRNRGATCRQQAERHDLAPGAVDHAGVFPAFGADDC